MTPPPAASRSRRRAASRAARRRAAARRRPRTRAQARSRSRRFPARRSAQPLREQLTAVAAQAALRVERLPRGVVALHLEVERTHAERPRLLLDPLHHALAETAPAEGRPQVEI